jgi:integrase/recombinase XerD
MSKRIRLPKSLFRCTQPDQPVIKPIGAWLTANQGFYRKFRTWLREGGYGDSALNLYSVAARLALGLLDKPYWLIDAQTDLERMRAYITTSYDRPASRAAYFKGLNKFAEYLRLRNRQPSPQKPINWDYYCAGFPAWLFKDVQAYAAHCRRNWRAEQLDVATRQLLSRLTGPLRWLITHTQLATLEDLTPECWFQYLDMRLEAGLKRSSLNTELYQLHQFLHFVAERERPVCQRMLRVAPLNAPPLLPRDVPADHLRRLQSQIEIDATADHAGIRRMGLMDRAWFLLMLHSGLRTGEVRRLCQADLDLPARRARIEQAKGLKDRIVYLSQPTVEAIQAYLPLRGPATTDHLFLFRHQPLSLSYCYERLQTYSQRCGLSVKPHQLRHSCATMLLNVGAPILTVQALLGHKHIDTTLGYARLYDGTIANDYYRAMTNIEGRFDLTGKPATVWSDPAQLLAMVDSLSSGTLNESQRETVQTLRTAILGLTEPETQTSA